MNAKLVKFVVLKQNDMKRILIIMAAAEIKTFARLGYQYSPAHSSDDLFVFLRDTTGGTDD